jgi:tRNA dimethylallyltransferase
MADRSVRPAASYQLPATKPALLAIVGETASGKSQLAMRLAQDFNGEIIAADSWTVYKGFDIGTSKPSEEDRKQICHHLLDVVEAPDGFNAPKFKVLAEAAIADIYNRGKLAIMAGGTGLYIDSVLYDFGFLPNLGPDERAALEAMELPQLISYAKEEGVDLSGIDVRNKRRVIRAIEAGGQRPTKGDLRPDALVIGIRLSNDELRNIVEHRVDQMLRAGLREEVKSLSKKYGWNIEPMKGIGYKEWREYFNGIQSLEETRRRIVSGTMNLAKRQRTWFRRSPDIQWFGSVDEAYDYAARLLNN